MCVCVCFFLCRLNECGIGEAGCVCLVAALRSNPLHLRELALLQANAGEVWLGELLTNPHYRLDTLK